MVKTALNGPKCLKMAKCGPKWPKTAQHGPVTKLWVNVGKSTFRMSTAQNGPKQPKAATNGPKWSQIPIDYECSLAKMAQLVFLPGPFEKNHYHVYFITMQSELTWLKNKQTNKQTKHQDLSEKIHQYYIENTYFCFRKNANKKTLSDKDCFLSLCWACFSINYIFCDFKRF